MFAPDHRPARLIFARAAERDRRRLNGLRWLAVTVAASWVAIASVYLLVAGQS
jgi:hypothetical protein